MAERKTTSKTTTGGAKAPAKAKPAAARSRATAAKKPAAKKAAAKKPPAAKAGAAKRPAGTPRVATTPPLRESKRTAAARTTGEAARDVALFDNLNALRRVLGEHVVVTAERLQETLDDAVRRGRILPDDAAEIAQRLSHAGRRGIDDLLSEVDRRLRRR